MLASPLGGRYVSDLDAMFDAYTDVSEQMLRFLRREVPKAPQDSEFAYRNAIKARALDAVRGMLPAATLSNVGIYGSGQAYEALLMRMRAHPLHEARLYAQMMLVELRKVIPSFLKRVDLPNRGQVTSRYMADNREAMDDLADRLFDRTARLGSEPTALTAGAADACTVELVDFDPDGEEKMVAAMLYPHTPLPERTVLESVRDMSHQQRLEIMRVYCGDRTNRRHRPGRALERVFYRFDVLSDYGSFRDLQRHRMLTIEWQSLSTRHGYVMPEDVTECGVQNAFQATMARSAELYQALLPLLPHQASYSVALAYRVRYSMQFNAREAMHMLELRTGSQGHPAYREVCQKMHRLIAEKAGHRAVAAMMSFVQHGDDPELGRLQAEQRQASKTPP